MIDYYKALKRPAARAAGICVYSVRNLKAGIFLARSAEDCPAFVFASPVGLSGPVRPVRLQHLSVSFRSECWLEIDGVTTALPAATVVECVGAPPGLADYFIDAVGASVQRLGPEVSESDVADMLERLAEVFRLMSQPASRESTGLWAELFLIANAANPAFLVRSWHGSSFDKFDFAHDLDRLEVKASMRESRCHHFAYDQVYPPAGCRGFVVSLMVRRSAAGVSLGELWRAVRERMETAADVLKVDEQCIMTLGAGWEQARNERFDREVARDTLLVFAVDDIPRVPLCTVPGVSDIHFLSDLTFSVSVREAGDSSLLGMLPAFAFKLQ